MSARGPRDGRWWRVPDFDLLILEVSNNRRFAEMAAREISLRRAALRASVPDLRIAHPSARLRAFLQLQRASWRALFSR